MKIALAQVNSTVADLPGNVDRVVAATAEARRLSADLVVFPEMALPGFSPRDLFFDASFVSALGQAHLDLAARLSSGPAVVVGSVVPAGPATECHPRLQNVALVIAGGSVQLTIAKRRLRSDGVFFESRWFEPGFPGPAIEVAGLEVELAVGDDLAWCGGRRELTTAVVSPTALVFEPDALQSRLETARTLGRSVVSVNGCGANDEVILGGRSFAMDGDGELLEMLPVDREAVRVVDLDAASGGKFEIPAAIEEFEQLLECGIRDFSLKNRLGRAFVGLSGGIDSSVVACLAVRALGADRVTGVAMPSRFTDSRSTDAARELAGNLGMELEVVDIDHLHAAVEHSLPSLVGGGVAAENAQARLRMLVLMAMVDARRGFLLNTSNKTELALGYGTSYGDLAGVLCPIGDLDKLQVVELGRRIAETSGEIPDFVLERRPTAELSPDQVDPFDYAEVVPVVNGLVARHRCSPAMRAAEHKRRQAGVVLKVSRVAFGSGRMIPVTRR